ncbi:MAG TPA: plastocyanin/azurin family copper-binding protein [Polyangia bacterium]|jgi:plastocyanin|nr:plastocyanin/azurin family copper-binding protein [Polyangia bacterium]
MTSLIRLTLGVLLAAGTTIACSSSNNNSTPGTGGSGGTGGGSAGASAGGTGGGAAGTGGASAGGTGGAVGGGGTGGTPAGFMAIAPCNAATDYVAGTTISFGGNVGFAYDPHCLKVQAGASVTFSGDFSFHPLEPSAMRGNTTSNPITAISAGIDGGTTASFTFPNAGFYAYFCSFHGASDTGAGMAGVIWVQ